MPGSMHDTLPMPAAMQGAADPAQVEERKVGVKRKLRERAVPASSIGRAWGFTQLGAGLVFGSASDAVSRVRTMPEQTCLCL